MKKEEPTSEPPKGAPAYMGQFASLMTILLAFFIVMLSLGQNRVAKFRVGVGQIRNMIGLQGGSGVLEFWRSMRNPPVPQVVGDRPEDEKMTLVGYQMGARDGFSLQAETLSAIQFDDVSKDLRIKTDIKFHPGTWSIQRETKSSLDHITTLLHSAERFRVDVEVWESGGANERSLATRRAVWIARYLVEHARIPADRIRSMGLLIDDHDNRKPEQPTVTFLLRRMEH
jgi:flagellar motor protein MotB